MIYNSSTGIIQDVPIYVECAPDTQIYNNTVYTVYSATLPSYPNAIEYRFAATTDVLVENNLTNQAIASRDDASGIVSNNVTNDVSTWFVNAAVGDLRLASAVSSVVE